MVWSLSQEHRHHISPQGPLSDLIEVLPLAGWSESCSASDQSRALRMLEAGKVIFLPNLRFEFSGNECRLLDPRCSDGKAKNISFDPVAGTLRGTSLTSEDATALQLLLRRFGHQCRTLLGGLFPSYAPWLQQDRASFRPVRVDQRSTSHRKDDRRLHLDAFPSRPTQGKRILRVFSNVNLEGEPRVWRLGEPFADVAARFVPQLRRDPPGTAWLLDWSGITKGRRSGYDQLMLRLHDRLKADADYQRGARQNEFSFPAGSTWIIYTDTVLHAAIGGQHALEQTFYLPVAAMLDPDLSPLRALEGMTGRRLTKDRGAAVTSEAGAAETLPR